MKFNALRISLLCSVALTTLVAGCAKTSQNFSTASNSLDNKPLVAEKIGDKIGAPAKSRLDAHLEAIYGKDAVAPSAPSGANHAVAKSNGFAYGDKVAAVNNTATRSAHAAPLTVAKSHSTSREEVASNHSHKHVSPKIAKLNKEIAKLSHKSPHSKKLLALKKKRAKLMLAENKKAKKKHPKFKSEAVASATLPSLAKIAGKQNELEKISSDPSQTRFDQAEAKIAQADAKAEAKREPIAQNKLINPNAFPGVDDGMPVPQEDAEDDRPLPAPVAAQDQPPAPVAANDILPKGPSVVPPAVNYPDNGDPIRPTNRYNQANNQGVTRKSKSSPDSQANLQFDAPDSPAAPITVLPANLGGSAKSSARSSKSKPSVEISQLSKNAPGEFAASDLAQGLPTQANQNSDSSDVKSAKTQTLAKNSSNPPTFKSVSGKELAKNKIAEKAVPVMAGHWTGDEEAPNDSVRISNDLQHIVADRVMEFDGNRCRVKTEGRFILADAQIGLINGDSSGNLREIRGTLISTPFTLASSSENADSCGQIIRDINEANVKVLTQGESVVVENEGDPILLIQGRRYTRSPAGSSKM